MVMSRPERLLVAAGAAFMQETILPVRRTGVNRPDYWTLPLTLTKLRPVPSQAGWQDFLIVDPKVNYEFVIKQYVATLVPYANPAGFDFRFVTTSNQPTYVNNAPNANLHVDALYPLVRRDTFLSGTDTDRYKLQVKNETGSDQTFAAAIFGWYYFDPDAAGEKSEGGIIDA